MPTPTVTDNDTPAADPSHLEVAQKFFSSDSSSETPEPTPSVTPAATDPAKGASKSEDLLSQVVKLPGAKETPAPKAGDTPPAVEEIDKGLQAPPENAKSRAGWDELKKRASEERRQRIELEQKLKAAEEKAKAVTPVADEATKARLQQLETENKQFSDRLKVLDLKSHPEFVDKYVKPQQEAKAALANVLKSDEAEVDLDALLSLKGKAFNKGVSDALEVLTPYARVQFQAALDRYIAAGLGAEQALSQADEFLKTANQNTGARSRAAFDKVSAAYTDHFVPVTVDEKADDATKAAAAEYNADLAAISKKAAAYAFGQLDEAGVAELAHKAALYDFTLTRGFPRIGQTYNAALATKDARIAELEKQVKALTVASPTIDGGSGAPPVTDAPAQEESHLEAARRFKWS